MIPSDPMRNPPLTFDEWEASFHVELEDQARLARAAKNLLENAAARRAMAMVEMKAVGALRKGTTEDDEAQKWRAILFGMASIRAQLRAMASEGDPS